MKCTWSDCSQEGSKPLAAIDGEEWANLCTDHNQLMDEAIDSAEPARILFSWIKAQGGSTKAAARMTGI